MILLIAAAVATERALSFDEALSLAGAAAPSVLSAHADVQSAAGALLSARSTFEPTFSLSGSYFSSVGEGQFQFGDYTSETTGVNTDASVSVPMATGTALGIGFTANQSDTQFQIEELDQEFGSPAWDSKLAFTLSQSLLQGHRLAYNLQGVRVAAASEAAANWAAVSARQRAVGDAAVAYWTLHYQRKLVEIAEQSRAATEEQARVVGALVEAGKLAPVERTRTEAALAQVQRAQIDAESAAAAAEDGLAALVGESLSVSITLATAPPVPPDIPADEDAVALRVLDSNPELRAARVSLASRREAVQNARHALLPELGVSAGFALRGYDESFSASVDELGAGKLPEWSLGGSLSVPLLNRADRGTVGQAEGALARAEADLAALSAATEQAARAAVRTVRSARRNVELADLNLRLAEETLAAERARLGEGRSLNKDLITAQKDLDQARAEAEKARIDWVLAVIEIERLKGGL